MRVGASPLSACALLPDTAIGGMEGALGCPQDSTSIISPKKAELGQAGKALQHPGSCRLAWQSLDPHSSLAWEPGPAALQELFVPGDESSLQGRSWEVIWCFLHNKTTGFYLALPPLLSIVFLV